MKLLSKRKVLRESPLNYYFQGEISDLKTKIASIEKNGAVLDRSETTKISQSLFNTSSSHYVGIESSLPSRYYTIYPTYLANHETYNTHLSRENISLSKRILIARSASDLRTDAFVNPQDYRTFINWHNKNGIGLYWIEQSVAETIQKELGLSTTDVGMWGGQYAATFQPMGKDGEVNIRLINGHDTAFAAVKKYVEAVAQRARKLTIEPNDLPVFTQEVVDQWDQYVGSQSFRDKHLAKFVYEQLKDAGISGGRVLDAAAGSGYETLSLLRRQLDVTANEIDPLWNRILMRRLEAEGFSIETYKYDWRNLSQHLKPVYSSIIAVGNSICMVIGKKQRQLCIDEFYKLLKPGGKLIVDLRNFEFIEAQLKNGKKYFSKGLLYNCEGMGGELSIEDEEAGLVKFSFFNTKTHAIMGSTIVQSIQPKEILSQLDEAGFKNIAVYSDLSSKKIEPEAELYTIVATK